MSIRILLADDHDVMRSGLRALLERQPNMEVVAEAGDGRTAVKLARRLSPDLVVMDITMPNMNGIEATRQILKNNAGVKVIALSVHADKNFVRAMFDAGALGYLLKSCALDELVEGILAVRQGKKCLSPGITGVTLNSYGSDRSGVADNLSSPLSAREREIVQLIAEGHSTKVIADRLYISARTVDTHRRHILDKLNIDNVAELTKYAVREGLTSLNP